MHTILQRLTTTNKFEKCTSNNAKDWDQLQNTPHAHDRHRNLVRFGAATAVMSNHVISSRPLRLGLAVSTELKPVVESFQNAQHCPLSMQCETQLQNLGQWSLEGKAMDADNSVMTAQCRLERFKYQASCQIPQTTPKPLNTSNLAHKLQLKQTQNPHRSKKKIANSTRIRACTVSLKCQT